MIKHTIFVNVKYDVNFDAVLSNNNIKRKTLNFNFVGK